MLDIINIPIAWQQTDNAISQMHKGTLSTLLHQFIKRYNERLSISNITVNFEMPNDAAGVSDGTFIIKLHVKLLKGQIIIAESSKRSIDEAMQDITRKIDNQTRMTDRQKHHDSERKQGALVTES